MSAPASTSSFIESKILTIPTGETQFFSIQGKVFLCKESTDDFEMSFNDGAFFDMEAGLGFELRGEDYFQKLGFRNTTASDIEVEFYAGNILVQDNRLVTPLTPTYTFNNKHAATRTTGAGVLTLGTLASTSYPGTNAGDDRCQFVVANLDASLLLYVLAADASVMGVVQPGTSWTIETNSSLSVYNPSAVSTVDYVVGETWYS